MATTRYTITYNVPATTRLQAILAAGALLRTGVRVLSLVGTVETVPDWWDVAFAVEETLSDPPEPKWLHEDPAYEQERIVAAAKADPAYAESVFLDGTSPYTDSEYAPAPIDEYMSWTAVQKAYER